MQLRVCSPASRRGSAWQGCCCYACAFTAAQTTIKSHSSMCGFVLISKTELMHQGYRCQMYCLGLVSWPRLIVLVDASPAPLCAGDLFYNICDRCFGSPRRSSKLLQYFMHYKLPTSSWGMCSTLCSTKFRMGPRGGTSRLCKSTSRPAIAKISQIECI